MPVVPLKEQPRGRVLLATGEVPVRLAVRGILVRRGYAVFEAPERSTAADILSHRHLDAMVLGADLPPDGAFSLLFDVDDPPPTLLMAGRWLMPPDHVLDRYPNVSAVIGRPFALGDLLGAFEHTLVRGPRAVFGPTY